MAKRAKTALQMERHLKGLGNHHRIEILLLVDETPGITSDAMSARLDANYKTIAQHANYLVRAGLLTKKHAGAAVELALSPYGETCVKFLKDFRTL